MLAGSGPGRQVLAGAAVGLGCPTIGAAGSRKERRDEIFSTGCADSFAGLRHLCRRRRCGAICGAWKRLARRISPPPLSRSNSCSTTARIIAPIWCAAANADSSICRSSRSTSVFGRRRRHLPPLPAGAERRRRPPARRARAAAAVGISPASAGRSRRCVLGAVMDGPRIAGSASARPSRRPLRDLLRMTIFPYRPNRRHPEERRQARLEGRNGASAASGSGPVFRRGSRRSRGRFCGRASWPRRISPAADTAGTCCRRGPRRAPASPRARCRGR